MRTRRASHSKSSRKGRSVSKTRGQVFSLMVPCSAPVPGFTMNFAEGFPMRIISASERACGSNDFMVDPPRHRQISMSKYWLKKQGVGKGGLMYCACATDASTLFKGETEHLSAGTDR